MSPDTQDVCDGIEAKSNQGASRGQNRKGLAKKLCKPLKFLVGGTGIEPVTLGL